jgi:hypothetical protein
MPQIEGYECCGGVGVCPPDYECCLDDADEWLCCQEYGPPQSPSQYENTQYFDDGGYGEDSVDDEGGEDDDFVSDDQGDEDDVEPDSS